MKEKENKPSCSICILRDTMKDRQEFYERQQEALDTLSKLYEAQMVYAAYIARSSGLLKTEEGDDGKTGDQEHQATEDLV